MAKNSEENLKRIAKFLKVPSGTIAINKEKVNNFAFFFFVSNITSINKSKWIKNWNLIHILFR